MNFRFLTTLIITFLISFTIFAQNNSYEQNLYYTCRVWGFLKYYHSEVAKGNINWDEELFETLDSLKTISTNEEFNNTVLELIGSAGNMAEPTTDPPEEFPEELSFNLNFEWINNEIFSDSTKSKLNMVKDWFRPQDNYYVTQVYSTPNFDSDNQFYNLDNSTNPSENHRLLALFRYWNIIRYFNPYNTILDQDWDSTLVKLIPKFAAAQNVKDYNKAIIELQSDLNDTHAVCISNFITNKVYGAYYLPLVLKYVENQTVVSRLLGSNIDLKPGDVITAIDGIGIEHIRDSLRIYVAASTQSATERIVNNLVIRKVQNNPALLTIQNENGVSEVEVSRIRESRYYYFYYNNYDDSWRIIDTNNVKYGYVNMGLLQQNEIEEMFTGLWNTDAIIFDIRNYPNATLWNMINYLFDAPIESADFTVPDVLYPGSFSWQEEIIGTGDFSQTYNNPIIILLNEDTQSQAEYTAMSFEQHPQAIKIGSQTAGADGNVTTVELPAGITVYFTSLGTYYPDRTPTQRIGIIPDIEVLPTIQGIREGRDEVLESAFEQVTSINDKDTKRYKYNLSQNFPNPFNPSTIIQYELAEKSSVKLIVYDILGNEVVTLIDSEKPAGSYKINFDGKHLSSGIYFYRIIVKNFVQTKKMLLIK